MIHVVIHINLMYVKLSRLQFVGWLGLLRAKPQNLFFLASKQNETIRLTSVYVFVYLLFTHAYQFMYVLVYRIVAHTIALLIFLYVLLCLIY